MEISEEFRTIIVLAREEAMRTGCYSITPDHIVLGILRHADNRACRILSELGINPEELRRHIEMFFFHPRSIPYQEEEKVLLTSESESLLKRAYVETTDNNDGSVRAVHLLLAVSHCPGSVSRDFLMHRGITADKLRSLAGGSGTERTVRTPAERRIIGTISIKAPEYYS
ncbi:MAG: hypothetical protein MJY42_01465 [Bacteroidales bacterium]|nr:hypothetical protein [Bacteroidales bacterium]